MEVTSDVAVEFSSAMRFLRRLGVVVASAVFVLNAIVVGVGLHLWTQTDNTVTQHNALLSQTLDVACQLVRSDPHLRVPPDCPPVRAEKR